MVMKALNVYVEEEMIVRIDALIGRGSRNKYFRDATEKQLVIDEAKLGEK